MQGGVRGRNNTAGILTTTFEIYTIVYSWTGDKCLILQGKNPIVMPQSEGPSERSDTQKRKVNKARQIMKKGDGGGGDGGTGQEKNFLWQ